MSNSKQKIIDVGMSDVRVASNGHILRSVGIGSCIVITLYDSVKKVGAMAHPMLAENITKKTDNSLRFVGPAIDAMIRELRKFGGAKDRLEAKIVGGANMFKVFDKNPTGIGAQNIAAAIEKLEAEGIKIVATDTGENCGRSVAFDLSSGLVEVKTKI